MPLDYFLQKVLLFLFFILLSSSVFGQFVNEYESKILLQDHVIKEYERWLRNGDKYGVFQLAGHLDDTTQVTEFLGYHVLQSKIFEITERILEENTSFLEEEFNWNDSVTKTKFEKFIYSNREKIHFSELSETFLITPLKERELDYKLQPLTPYQIQDLEAKKTILLKIKSLERSWINSYEIDTLLAQKNPKALLKIAQHLFHIRSRFNEYYHYFEGHQELLQLLTRKNIFVKDEKGKYTHTFNQNKEKTTLHLLTFFAKYYQNFEWNEAEGYFEAKGLKVEEADIERYWFDLIHQDDDSLALLAFQNSILSDNTELILNLNEEYKQEHLFKSNGSLPSNLSSFIPIMLNFSQYCKSENIELLPSPKVKKYIAQMNDTTIGYDDYEKIDKLEKELLENIYLDEITAIEFHFFTRQSGSNFYTGRFLDKFYSQKWDSLVHSPKHLKLYLKKMSWFENTRIIAYYYITKFYSDDKKIANLLNNLKTEDKEIHKQIARIKKMNASYAVPNCSLDTISSNAAPIKDFEEKFATLIELAKEGKDEPIRNSYILDTLLENISYSQIGKTIELLESAEYYYEFSKYNFMHENFGISGFSTDSTFREKFLLLYDSLNQYELYEHFLKSKNIDYKKEGTNDLDYDKIYELLKYEISYDINCGEEPNSYIYFIIKLLENKFETTLGYSENLKGADEYYITQVKRRKNKWKMFLEQNDLLKKKDVTPPSFTYFIDIKNDNK